MKSTGKKMKTKQNAVLISGPRHHLNRSHFHFVNTSDHKCVDCLENAWGFPIQEYTRVGYVHHDTISLPRDCFKVRSDQTFCFGYWETESDVAPTSAATDGAVAHLGQRLRTWALEPRSRFKSCFHHISAMKLASCSISLGLFLICKTRTTAVPALGGCCEH